eukprot:6206242-Amphidinium_carterae.1
MGFADKRALTAIDQENAFEYAKYKYSMDLITEAHLGTLFKSLTERECPKRQSRKSSDTHRKMVCMDRRLNRPEMWTTISANTRGRSHQKQSCTGRP